MASAPQPAWRQLLRHVQLGLALGTAALLVGSWLAFHVEGPVRAAAGDGPVGFLGVVAYALVGQVPALVACPTVAFVAGLFVDAPRWRIAASMVVVVQGFIVAVGLVTNGAGLLSLGYVAVAVGGAAGGVVLSALSFGRAQRLMRAREDARARAAVEAGRLSAIDFAAVKREVPQQPEENSADSGGEGG